MKPPVCPLCGGDQDAEYRPFCSRRCADVDLHRWLVGRYAISADVDDDDGPPAAERALDED